MEEIFKNQPGETPLFPLNRDFSADGLPREGKQNMTKTAQQEQEPGSEPVSYTHLTLPTIYSV